MRRRRPCPQCAARAPLVHSAVDLERRTQRGTSCKRRQQQRGCAIVAAADDECSRAHERNVQPLLLCARRTDEWHSGEQSPDCALGRALAAFVGRALRSKAQQPARTQRGRMRPPCMAQQRRRRRPDGHFVRPGRFGCSLARGLLPSGGERHCAPLVVGIRDDGPALGLLSAMAAVVRGLRAQICAILCKDEADFRLSVRPARALRASPRREQTPTLSADLKRD